MYSIRVPLPLFFEIRNSFLIAIRPRIETLQADNEYKYPISDKSFEKLKIRIAVIREIAPFSWKEALAGLLIAFI